MKPRMFLAVGAMLALLSSAQATTFVYGCRYEDDSKLYSAKLDTTKHTLTWRGSVYEKLKDITAESGLDLCAKQCFRATRRDGAIALFDIATQGVASLTTLEKNQEGGTEFDCDLLRQ